MDLHSTHYRVSVWTKFTPKGGQFLNHNLAFLSQECYGIVLALYGFSSCFHAQSCADMASIYRSDYLPKSPKR